MPTIPDRLDAELRVKVDDASQLIGALESVIERFLTEYLCTGHTVLGALEDVKQLIWHRIEAERQRQQRKEDEDAQPQD